MSRQQPLGGLLVDKEGCTITWKQQEIQHNETRRAERVENDKEEALVSTAPRAPRRPTYAALVPVNAASNSMAPNMK